MKWFTSDMHFGHSRILELGEGRPFGSIREHDAEIVRRWNSVVSPTDEVFMLGDIVMGLVEENIVKIQRLNGVKHLVAGNHDSVFSGTNSKARVERFMPLYLNAGINLLNESESLEFEVSWGMQTVLLSHFQYGGDSHTLVDKFAKHRYENTGLPLLHGHTHSRSALSANPLEFHVGVDAHDFHPVPETRVVEWLEGLRKNDYI